MSMFGQKEQDGTEQPVAMDEWLLALRDQSLIGSHRSVQLSFNRLLEYVDEVRNTVKDADLNALLAAYKDLAKKYYLQFELSLLEEIREKDDLQRQIRALLESANGSTLDGNEAARAALAETAALFGDEKKRLMDRFPSLLQDALDKLRDEWQRLYTISIASQTDPVEELRLVVKLAAYSVGIQDKQIIVVPGRDFALFFFAYLNNLAVLTVPIYSLGARWDWSIFWHELAGYQVHELGKSARLSAIRDKLLEIHTYYQTLSRAKRKNLLSVLTNDVAGSKQYLEDLFSKPHPDFKDLGGFDHQFEQISLRLTPRRKDRFVNYESMKKKGWSMDWVKELFEDAFSVLTFRYWFLKYFADILNRYDKEDERHPPKRIRLAVAREMLTLAGFSIPAGHAESEETFSEATDQEKKEREEEDKIVKFAARQIFNFVTLVLAASRFDADRLAGATQSQYVSPDDLRKGLDALENLVKHYLQMWSKKVDSMPVDLEGLETQSDNQQTRLDEIRDFIGHVLKVKAPEQTDDFLFKSENGRRVPKNYRELLALSFYNVDYHSPGDIQLLESGLTYWVKPVDWNSNAWSAQRRAYTPGTPVLFTHTIVTRVSDGSQWSVNKSDWNSWFKMTQ